MKLFKMTQNFSTKKKMYTGFSVVLGIMSIVVVVVLINLLQAQQQIKTMTTEIQPATITSLKLSNDLQKAITELGFYMLSKDKSRKESYLKKIATAEKSIEELSKKIHANESNASLPALKAIKNNIKKLKSSQNKLFDITESIEKNYPAASYTSKNINPISQKILASLQFAIESEIEEHRDNPRLEIVNSIQDMRYTWSRIMGELRAFIGFHSQYNLDAIGDNLEVFNGLLSNMQNKYSESLTFEQEEAIANFDSLITQFNQQLKKVSEIHLSDEWRQDAWLIKTDVGKLVNAINANLDILINEKNNQSISYASKLTSNTSNTIYIVVTLLLVAIAAVVALVWLLTAHIIKPMTSAVDKSLVKINDIMTMMSEDKNKNVQLETSDDEIENVEKTLSVMTDTLAEIAENQIASTSALKLKIQRINDVVSRASNGDLTGQLENFDGNENIDTLASGIQSMIDGLNKLVSQVQHSGIQVTSSSTEIAATAREQEATVTEQAAATNQIMATATQISATSRELASTMHEVAEVADKTTMSANDGQDALANMENTMMQMNNATASITSKLAVLNEKAANINTVVTTITKVADQTNLLSLNAAIEAEKAGEYGLGFAVVATEIRRLADQTAVATWDIEQMVKEMQSAVSAGVMGMDKFSEEVTRGVDEVRQIGGQLAQIIEEVQTLTPRFEAVNEGMQSQSHGAHQISDGMVQLNEATQQTVESLRQSGISINTLKEAANKLQNGVSQFRVQKG